MQLPFASTFLVRALAPEASGPASEQPDAQQQIVGDGQRDQIIALLNDIREGGHRGPIHNRQAQLNGFPWSQEVSGGAMTASQHMNVRR